jgi:DNA repair exonuclease SbcCD nuclease subunit
MPLKIIRVGDPHIRPNNIEESGRLMEFVEKTATETKADRIEILGDLFHTRLAKNFETIVLVGNHDMPGNIGSDSHALTVFKKSKYEKLKIIDKPIQIGFFGYMPYYHENSEFERDANKLFHSGTSVLVCHGTFAGSQYDNGFYAPNGINPDGLPFHTIISGHVHKEQIIANGKVDYPGTPKWDSASDANENKGIWYYEHDDITGKVLARKCISTASICVPIVSFVWLEGETEPSIPLNSRATVELVGSSDWVSKKKNELKGKFNLKSKITDKKNKIERKSSNSLENFMMNMYDTKMDRDILLNYAKELGIVQQ